MAIATINPATGETIKTFTPLSDAEIETRLARADAAFRSYRDTSFSERAGWMRAAADLLDAESLGSHSTLPYATAASDESVGST